MSRKPVQLVYDTAESLLFALCDDGTIWAWFPRSGRWDRCPDIPATDVPQRIAGSAVPGVLS